MKTGMRTTAAATAILVLVSACQTTGSDSGQLVLAKSGLTIAAFDTDVDACEAYVVTESPSESEQGAATAASFLLGGIIGGIAAASAYDNNKKRLMRECMYGKGYRQVAVPEDWNNGYGGSQGQFQEYEATRDLIDQGRLEVLLAPADGTNRLASVQPDAEPTALSNQLAVPAQGGGAAANTAGTVDQETQIWQIVENTTDPKDLNFYLNAYPDGKYIPLANKKLASLNTVVVANVDFPYDGTWSLKIDMARTQMRDRGPDLCNLATDPPTTVSIREGVLEFLIGSSVPTIVDAEISNRGRARGSVSTAGYAGEVSTFDIKASSSTMTIPFRVADSCSGSFVLRKRPNAVVGLIEAENSELSSTETTTQVSRKSAQPAHAFNGVWKARVTSSKILTYSGGPDICYSSVKVPETIVVENGFLKFDIGENNLTLVHGAILENGTVAGSLDSRGWNGQTRRFTVEVRGSELIIPYKVGHNCEGTVVLIRQEPANEASAETANLQTALLSEHSLPESSYPYDGRWRVTIDLTATRQIAWDPDICKFSARKPDRVTVKDGALNFVVGSGTPSIVTADISQDGEVSGEIDSRGYGGHKSSFNVMAKSKIMTIPFKIGTSCEGNILLRRS